MARGAALALAAAIALSLLAVSGAGGAGAQTPKRGGSVVIATLTQGEPPCLNPLLDACGTLGPLDRGLSEVLAGAFEVKPDGTFRPSLVSRAEIVSKRPAAIVYHIRPEARWSDGAPVTASDFVFTHRAILERRPGFAFLHLNDVLSVRALDAKTVKVVLRAPNPDWRLLFDLVLPRHALAGRDLEAVWSDRIDNPKTGEPIGSGPFLVGSWERGRQLTLVRNPRSWGAHVSYLNRIVFRFLPTEDAGEALRRGEVDMINPSSRVMQPQALELLRQPVRGIRVPRVSAPARSSSPFESGRVAIPRSRAGSFGRRSPTGSTALRSPGGSESSPWRVRGRSRPSTASSSWRTARTTGRIGRATGTDRLGRGVFSSRRAVAWAQTASTPAPANGSCSAW